MVFILKKFFDGIPRDCEDAARVDGAARWRIFWSVVLPLSRPILAAVGDLHVHRRLEQLPVAVHRHHRPATDDDAGRPRQRAGLPTACGTPRSWPRPCSAGLPLLVVFLLFQRQIVRGRRHHRPSSG